VFEDTADVLKQSTLWAESVAEYFVTGIDILTTYIVSYIDSLPEFYQKFFEALAIGVALLWETLQNLLHSSFSEFQITLLQVFFGIFTIQVIAICLAWKIYSVRITDRFLKPSHYQISNDQLKTAVSELKLPAEHTPRW
jgi:hypothetical protein